MGRHSCQARLLMSPPSRLDVHHLLNPWMRWDEAVDGAEASRQWDRLVEVVREAGGQISVMPSEGRSAAITFTRDVAVTVGAGRAIVLRNHGRRGDLEPRHVSSWLRDSGFGIEELSEDDRIDGGNLLACPEGWLIGIPPGGAVEPALRLAPRLEGRVMCIPLARPEFAHLDTVLADLAGRAWLAYPGGFVDARMEGRQWQTLLGDRPVIIAQEEEARRLACNVVVVGDAVIGGGLSPRLCRAIEGLGLSPVPLDLDEFRKAGGGAHCLTLDLDAPAACS